MTLHINNPELEAELQRFAKKIGQQPDVLASSLLSRSLDAESRYESEKVEDEQRWQAYKEGSNTLSNKDMKSHFAQLKEKAMKRAAEIG
ncbi:MAG: hypothetical protein ACC707_07030 [Thiohalomonadales bacterium]